MARGKYNKVTCDVCGFSYLRNQMKKNSYNLWVCPEDYEKGYDLVNHPQNKHPNTFDKSGFIRNVRPENNNDRNIVWELGGTWEETSKNWNQI